MNLFAQHKRHQISAISRGCDADISAEQEQINTMYEAANAAYDTFGVLRPNFIGNVLFSVAAPTLLASKDGICVLNERNQALQTRLEGKMQ